MGPDWCSEVVQWGRKGDARSSKRARPRFRGVVYSLGSNFSRFWSRENEIGAEKQLVNQIGVFDSFVGTNRAHSSG